MLEIGDLVTHKTLSPNQEAFGYPQLQGIVKKVVNKNPHTHVQVFWLNSGSPVNMNREWFLSNSLTKLS